MGDQTTIQQDDLAVHEAAARDAHDHGILTEWDRAAERGRAMAEDMLILDPSRKKLVESVYGIAYCKNRYPRAYKNTRRT